MTLLLPLLLLAQYPSVPPVDSPALAVFGAHDVGVRTVEITNPQQPDILKLDAATGKAPLADRRLKIEVWYPAQLKPGEKAHTIYTSPMVGRTVREELPRTFTFAGKAARDAEPKVGARYPLVIVSHGYPGSRTFMTYITENLASKGYVVAAIDHTDSVFGEVRAFQSTLVNRALDQLFTLNELSTNAALFTHGIVDGSKAAIIGYSMGGYGVMTSAGAAASVRQLPVPKPVPSASLKAIVAIAPWGAQPPFEAWTAESAKGLKVPSLFIAGDHDDVSGYEQGVKKLYNWSTSSSRCLLTYQQARHNTGANPVPEGFPQDFQARASFEEPVWRKERITAINQHFISAFLDAHLRGETAKLSYFKVDEKGAFPGFQPRWSLGIAMDCQAAN